MRNPTALAVALAIVVAAPAHADAPSAARKSLERHALTLAKKGRADGVSELLDILRELGHDADAVAKLRGACDDALAKAKKRAPQVNDVAKALVQLADDLADDLAALEGDAKERRARRLAGRS